MKIQDSTSEIPLNSREYFISFFGEDFPFLRLPLLVLLTHIRSSCCLEIAFFSLLHKLLKGGAELLGISYSIICCGVWSMVNHRNEERRRFKPNYILYTTNFKWYLTSPKSSGFISPTHLIICSPNMYSVQQTYIEHLR